MTFVERLVEQTRDTECLEFHKNFHSPLITEVMDCFMKASRSSNRLQISTLICGSLAAWGLSCLLVHGPVILAYVGIQAVTSGVFAVAIYRAEKAHQNSRIQPSTARPALSESTAERKDDVLQANGIAV